MVPMIPADKAQHYFWGSLAGLAGALLAAYLVSRGAPRILVPAAALLLALAAGVAKEIADRRANEAAIDAGGAPPHEVSRADAAWTVTGAVPVALAAAALAFWR